MTAPWEVTKNPKISDVVRRLREQAEDGAMANNHATGRQSFAPEDFQSWHDAEAVAAMSSPTSEARHEQTPRRDRA